VMPYVHLACHAQAEPDQLGPNGEWWFQDPNGLSFFWCLDPNPMPKFRLFAWWPVLPSKR
jgi:hypothetical protein